jgi:hypothetical protein
MRGSCRWLFLPALFAANIGGAADFDGSKPLICTTQYVTDLTGPDEFESGLPAEMGAPTFMRVDFQKKHIAGPKQTTNIQSMEASENQILLHGTELGLGWSLAIRGQDGKMTGSLVDAEGVIAMFGACMPL